MKLDNTKDIFAELLRAASRGYGDRNIENPSVSFIRDVNAGAMRNTRRSSILLSG